MAGIDYSKEFNVYILKDCRKPEEYGPSGNLTSKVGVCLGIFCFPNTWERARIQNTEHGRPLIYFDGEYIWGGECSWVRLENIKGVSAESEFITLKKLREKRNKRPGLGGHSLN